MVTPQHILTNCLLETKELVKKYEQIIDAVLLKHFTGGSIIVNVYNMDEKVIGQIVKLYNSYWIVKHETETYSDQRDGSDEKTTHFTFTPRPNPKTTN